jgi:putative endonuclease
VRVNQFYVYIVASRSRVLYIGVSNDLERRIYEHKQKLVPSFTAKYNVNRLVYYEDYPDALSAIQREKPLKGWKRCRKIELIESSNPQWRDLSEEWDESTVSGAARET